MATNPTLISVRVTEQLVDALNHAVELDGDAEARIDLLLRRLQTLLERQTRCALWLLEDLERRPSPRIVQRVVVRPSFDSGPIGGLEEAQHAFDESTPLSRIAVHSVLAHIRTPVTMVASQVGATGWFESVLVPRHLQPLGYADCVVSMWAATANRAIVLVVHRREVDPPFTDKDTTMVSLMLRAAAPIVDREIFHKSMPDHLEQLTPREREILLLLLAGDSEKQIAAQLIRSINTVHTFVRQIYRQYEVSSRGELMALFVDRAVLKDLRQAAPT